MNTYTGANHNIIIVDTPRRAATRPGSRLQTIKTESSSSSSSGGTSTPFQFTFSAPIHPRSRSQPEASTGRIQSLHTFRPPEPFTMSWASGQNLGESIPSNSAFQDCAFENASLHQNMPFPEEGDDLSEFLDRPGSLSTYPSMPGSPSSAEKTIRRRSSKGEIHMPFFRWESPLMTRRFFVLVSVRSMPKMQMQMRTHHAWRTL